MSTQWCYQQQRCAYIYTQIHVITQMYSNTYVKMRSAAPTILAVKTKRMVSNKAIKTARTNYVQKQNENKKTQTQSARSNEQLRA